MESLYLLGRTELIFFFCWNGVHKALSEFMSTKCCVLLCTVPLPEVPEVGDYIFVSCQEQAGKCIVRDG